MDLMDTTIARKLPKPPLTTVLFSPPSMFPQKLLTLKPSRPAWTNAFLFPVGPAKTKSKIEPSPSPRSKTLGSLSRNATPNCYPLSAKKLNLLFPSKSVLNWSMDMIMNPNPPMFHPTPSLLLKLKLLVQEQSQFFIFMKENCKKACAQLNPGFCDLHIKIKKN